jgi:hypothetical protein
MDLPGDETYPATVGQLSVWRDIEKLPPERLWEANLLFVWDLPGQEPGAPALSAERIWAALAALAVRHGSLRTTYVVDGQGFPRQRLLDGAGDGTGSTAEMVLNQIRQGTADVAERAAMETAELQRAIDVTRELPWRAWILSDAGRPAHVLLVVNHMAADGFASLVMNEDFLRLLAGETLPPAIGPLELALDEQGEGNARLRTAERYWRRTMAAAPRRRGEGQERIGATLHTGIPMPLAHEAAAKLDATAGSALLAAYYRAVCAVTGERTQLMFPMTANRFDERHAVVVTSLNQWVPMLLEFDEAEPFEAVVSKMHWKMFNARKNGLCSPDAILAIRDEQADADPGYYYNPMLTDPGFPSEDSVVPSTVEWYEPARATGPGFYVICRGITSLDLVLRVNRPGWDRPRLEAFLQHLQGTFADAFGGHRL